MTSIRRPASPGPGGWYLEVPPPERLKPWVASLWEMRIPGLSLPARVRILPNACVDLVLYLSEASRGEGPAAIVAPPHRSYVVGSTLRSFMVQSVGWRHVIGASLLPAGTIPLLGAPASEIGESVAFLPDILGRAGTELEDRVIDGPADGALQRLADALFELGRSRSPDPAIADQAVDLLRQAGGRLRIDALADDLSVSIRRLERHFLKSVGLPPKLFARLVRFDRAVRDLGSRGARPWAQFAIDHGYADQAHFINEFHEFAGVSPAELEAESQPASD
jgi:AraC-like DNA-binding protein